MKNANAKYSRVLNPLNGKEIIVKSVGKVNGTLPSSMSKYRTQLKSELLIRGKLNRGEIQSVREMNEKNFHYSDESKQNHIAFLVLRKGLTIAKAEKAYNKLLKRAKVAEQQEDIQPKLNQLLNKYKK